MNRKKRIKKQLAIQHREERYMHAINKVIDGNADPEYAKNRWDKLQGVRNK